MAHKTAKLSFLLTKTKSYYAVSLNAIFFHTSFSFNMKRNSKNEVIIRITNIKKLDLSIAELIGSHIGDGTFYQTKRSRVWEIRGALDEKAYYEKHIKTLLETIFINKEFKPKFRSGGKNGCFGIQTTDKEVIQFLLDYGFMPGTKTYTVRIPSYIKKSNKEIQFAFIRGLFDTDGCLRFEKINKKEQRTYPRIEFGFASINLRNDLFGLLHNLRYRVQKWGKGYYKVGLSGVANLEKFIKEIAPKNKKHIKKYKLWKKYGCYDQNAAVA